MINNYLDYILIEYRYKWQLTAKSYHKYKSIEEVIDWLERFNTNKLEDFIEPENIEEIRIIFQESPEVLWVQIHKDKIKKFTIVLIINDYPLGDLISFETLILYLKTFGKNLKKQKEHNE